jgi:uncharacterized protein YeaO (DUF488 family)
MAKGFKFNIKRVQEKALKKDGMRILVDRLWPRGMTEEDAQVNMWCKELAPSSRLRKWYAQDPAKWQEFKARYMAELEEQGVLIIFMLMTLPSHTVTLVSAGAEKEMDDLVVLKEYLEKVSQM